MRQRKILLCKVGLHKVNENKMFVNRNRKGFVTSRSAFCKRCKRKLYIVDRFGFKKYRIDLRKIYTIVIRFYSEYILKKEV